MLFQRNGELIKKEYRKGLIVDVDMSSRNGFAQECLLDLEKCLLNGMAEWMFKILCS